MKTLRDELFKAAVGRKVVSVFAYLDDGKAWTGMRLDDGTALVFARDPEGNGPGHVFIDSPQCPPGPPASWPGWSKKAKRK